MFQQMKNIDSAFKYVRGFTLLVIAGSLAITCFAIYKSYEMVNGNQKRIFILANNKAIEAYASDRKDNVAVEAKDEIKTFHNYFFTLSPDDKEIQSNITKALYLADASAKKEYDNLKESGYYTDVISANISQEITVDSIQLDLNQIPYYFKCYATQKITRTTSVLTRNLITEGYLRNVARSENNSHGFLIERWNILENKDLKIEKR
jgi:conjugative transposon TraK protein